MSTFEIPIKSDEDGFILLQCSLCGEFFKVPVRTLNDDSTLNIWCPYCGLNGKKYFTEEVLDISLKIAKNEANRMIYNSLKVLEGKNRNNKFINFKAGKKPSIEVINLIKPRIENMQIMKYDCCKTMAKIKPVFIVTGSYCPLCGGANFE